VNSLHRLIHSKHDTQEVKALNTLGYPALEYALPKFIEWLQDINWLVDDEVDLAAREILNMLACST
jgi:Domain of unknown function (DUF5071)